MRFFTLLGRALRIGIVEEPLSWLAVGEITVGILLGFDHITWTQEQFAIVQTAMASGTFFVRGLVINATRQTRQEREGERELIPSPWFDQGAVE